MTRLELEIELFRIAELYPDHRDALERAVRIVNNSRIQLEDEQRPTAYEAGYRKGHADSNYDDYWKIRFERSKLKRTIETLEQKLKAKRKGKTLAC
jgi:hypothetical protein